MGGIKADVINTAKQIGDPPCSGWTAIDHMIWLRILTLYVCSSYRNAVSRRRRLCEKSSAFRWYPPGELRVSEGLISITFSYQAFVQRLKDLTLTTYHIYNTNNQSDHTSTIKQERSAYNNQSFFLAGWPALPTLHK